jgi:hypothetical protein
MPLPDLTPAATCEAPHASKPLADHLADFRRFLTTKGNTSRHVKETADRVQAVLDGCAFKYPSDLCAVRVSSWLADQRQMGMGTTTSNHYLTAAKGFCAWLVRERRPIIRSRCGGCVDSRSAVPRARNCACNWHRRCAGDRELCLTDVLTETGRFGVHFLARSGTVE